jgi:hypothetical protein
MNNIQELIERFKQSSFQVSSADTLGNIEGIPCQRM